MSSIGRFETLNPSRPLTVLGEFENRLSHYAPFFLFYARSRQKVDSVAASGAFDCTKWPSSADGSLFWPLISSKICSDCSSFWLFAGLKLTSFSPFLWAQVIFELADMNRHEVHKTAVIRLKAPQQINQTSAVMNLTINTTLNLFGCWDCWWIL